MADECIRREDAINVAQNYHCSHDITIIPNTDYSRGFYDGLAIRENDILQGLSELKPSTDVVQVCRCANCIHHAYDEIFFCYWCEHPGMVREVKPDFYCAYGERKE